ncbi:expressed unknown protein [Seminavis robusta]|uniref:Uncharacterized protein n=1 Tax=Seminavis robusta TaxID=568900 RepID=A0A9N8DAS1_9STRA|nr:expressed unknown protein [Seminavis robusta]|eukprot:Sro13_g010300.1 n/a (384) ;mRNA; r:172109-173260
METEFYLSMEEDDDEEEEQEISPPKKPLEEAKEMLELLKMNHDIIYYDDDDEPLSYMDFSPDYFDDEEENLLGANTCANMVFSVALLERLFHENDGRLFRALCLEQARGFEKSQDMRFLCRRVLTHLLNHDLSQLLLSRSSRGPAHCHSGRINLNHDPWSLPSCELILQVLQGFPEEVDSFCVHRGPGDDGPFGSVAIPRRWSSERSCEFLHVLWEDCMGLCALLLRHLYCAPRDTEIPTSWIRSAYMLWQWMVDCLTHPAPAKAVLWGADQSLMLNEDGERRGFKSYFIPLLATFGPLRDTMDACKKQRPDPLFHYPYQVAALLVAHSHRFEHDPQNRDAIFHTKYLHQIIVSHFDEAQILSWNKVYMPWAAQAIAASTGTS